jgi:pantothenate kinase
MGRRAAIRSHSGSARLGGVLHFIKFETRRLDNALKIVQQAGLVDGMKRVYMSGGGAFKFAALIEEQLRVKCVPVDEFEALVWGIDYVLEDGPPDEVYTMQGQGQGQGQGGDASGAGGLRTMAEVVVHPGECLSQPYMVVNIGSGVSFLKVRPLSSMDGGSFPRFERCGGTAIGGATFWGMARLMTDASTFEEVMELCRKGDAGQVDKLVKDIYGGDYAKVGLKGDVIASSFGKLCAMDNPKQQARQEDLALALLKMITAQITNLAANVAKLHGVSRIFFVGGFLRFNEISRPQIAHFCMRYFNIQALFLRHAEFLGAIGALDEASRDQGLGVE